MPTKDVKPFKCSSCGTRSTRAYVSPQGKRETRCEDCRLGKKKQKKPALRGSGTAAIKKLVGTVGVFRRMCSKERFKTEAKAVEHALAEAASSWRVTGDPIVESYDTYWVVELPGERKDS